MTSPFLRYELRTTDPIAARAFYLSVLGPRAADLDVTALPERARAAGAPSHWLGFIAGDVEHALAAGAERVRENVLRDPLGAVFAAIDRDASPWPKEAPIVWHQLNTTDVARAKRFYAEAFGWNDTEPTNVSMHDFAATMPGTHAAWLFHFGVSDLDATAAKVKAAGGLVAGVVKLPGGDRLAVCDDPQGAFVAFRGA